MYAPIRAQAVADVLIWGSAALGFVALHDASGAAAVVAADGHVIVVHVRQWPFINACVSTCVSTEACVKSAVLRSAPERERPLVC